MRDDDDVAERGWKSPINLETHGDGIFTIYSSLYKSEILFRAQIIESCRIHIGWPKYAEFYAISNQPTRV